MNKTSHPVHRKQGYVLLISLIFSALIALGSALLFRVSAQNAFSETKRADHIRAIMIAEAGAHQAFAMLTDNFDLRNKPFPVIKINGGISNIEILDLKSTASSDKTIDTKSSAVKSTTSLSNEILLKSTGSYNGADADVALIIRKTTKGSSGTTTDPDVLKYFKGACFCGGNASFEGDVNLKGTTCHVNGLLKVINSSSIDCAYTSTSQSSVIGGSRITPAAHTGTPEQMIEIDLQPFHDYAKAKDVSGSYHYGATSWNSKTLRDPYISASEISRASPVRLRCDSWGGVIYPNGGVLYIEGNAFFASNTEIYGCVIATGDIVFEGPCKHHKYPGKPNLPALISINGKIRLAGNPTINGLVYTHNGNVNMAGACTINGAFVVPRGNLFCGTNAKVNSVVSVPAGPDEEDVMLPKPDAGTPDGPPALVGWVK